MNNGQARITVTLQPSGEIRLGVVPLEPPRDNAGANLSIATKGKITADRSFTRLGKSRVRNGAAAMEENYGRENIRFLTGTLPGSTIEAQRILARYSKWLIQRLTQWFRDVAPGGDYVWVWELQKRGALHLHACFAHTDGRALKKLERRWHTYWLTCLDRISRESGVDLYGRRQGGSWSGAPQVVRADCQRVKKSVSRYLSKYLSKRASKSAIGEAPPPSQWWAISTGVRRLVTMYSRLAGSAPQAVSHCLSELDRIGGYLAAAAVVTYPCMSPVQSSRRSLIAFTSGWVDSKALFDEVSRMVLSANSGPVSPPDRFRVWLEPV